MLDKLQQTEEKFNHLEALLSDPAVASDPVRFVEVMKEYRSLSPIVEAYRALGAAEEAVRESLALLSEETDPELRQLANDELREGRERVEILRRDLTLLLLPRDPNDEKNVIVEIRAGAGGEEAALFAAVL